MNLSVKKKNFRIYAFSIRECEFIRFRLNFAAQISAHTVAIWMIFGYVFQNVGLYKISKNCAFLAYTKGATKNTDISVRIGDFPKIFIYVVHIG